MEIIPVIDLLNGSVVRAQRGDRAAYRPIHSALCESHAPLDIAHALMGLYPFASLYIADLNAIQGSGDNTAAILEILTAFPDIELWLDSGLRHPEQWHYDRGAGMRCIIGSESVARLEDYVHLRESLPHARPILSLDFRQDCFLGPDPLLTPEYWTETVIAMPLARVGSYHGPDLEKLSALKERNSAIAWVAAGGVRDVGDLQCLEQAGMTAALVASSLHDGRLSADEIARFNR